MAWNAHAHGSAVHFLARVAAYRQAIGAAAVPLVMKLSAFPLAVIATSPLVCAGALVAAPALVIDRRARRRWAWPLVAAAAILAFLVEGDLRDGAPTHHPERAVLPILWILAAFAVDGCRALVQTYAWGRAQRESIVVGLVVAGGLAWVATLPARYRDYPGASESESREAQIARGRELRAEASAGHVTVTPCAYEHFALIAAFGAPERVDIAPATAVSPGGPACPRVQIRE
jgi:hypothetical protein